MRLFGNNREGQCAGIFAVAGQRGHREIQRGSFISAVFRFVCDTNEISRMFYETRNYRKVCEHFDDFGLCDDAMLAWAIDMGWDLDSVLTETENALETTCILTKIHNTISSTKLSTTQ